MYFTNYIITENAPSSVDPLGLLRPSSAITDGLFKTFTVLSNHPANHGFLCWAYLFLRKNGIAPGTASFSRSFREIEILWGLLNAQVNSTILNVTKYKVLLQRNELALSRAKKYQPLFDRLNYGVLGHYSSPSAFWGLLEPKRERLSLLGEALGAAWEYRQGVHFQDIAEAWLDGTSLDDIKNIDEVQQSFRLDAEPELSEQDVWQKTIRQLCEKTPVISPLWNTPVPSDILKYSENAEDYSRFFPEIEGHFGETQGELCRRIRLCQLFEIVSGFVQLIFDWEYVSRLPQAKNLSLDFQDLKLAISKHLPIFAKELIRNYAGQSTWKLAHLLSESTSYKVQVQMILDHHAAHQKSKGATSFIVNDEIVAQDRVDVQTTVNRLKWFQSDLEDLVNRVAFTYKRNWHFGRAQLWLEYAGGLK